MIKLILSILLTFLFLFAQNWLVMTWHGYSNLVYGNDSMILMMLVIDFFLAYSILHSIESALPDSFKPGGQEEQI